MDAVITYVDGQDPVWQKEYSDFVGKPVLAKRFRDWGTLKYLLRGIETYMPFIERVFLVVSSESQVPGWVDRTQLKIVCHRDIIPSHFLPVFNSTAIEMFLHRIEGLSEEFIYFNDDFFPLAPCEPSDFFSDGKIKLNFSLHRRVNNLYMRHVKNSDALARHALSLPSCETYMRPQHSCAPMLRSECDSLFSKVSENILESISRLREPYNVNQYLFQDYLYYKGMTQKRDFPTGHISLAIVPLCLIKRTIVHTSRKVVCINDVSMPDRKFRRYRKGILEAFESKFPRVSRFEI